MEVMHEGVGGQPPPYDILMFVLVWSIAFKWSFSGEISCIYGNFQNIFFQSNDPTLVF